MESCIADDFIMYPPLDDVPMDGPVVADEPQVPGDVLPLCYKQMLPGGGHTDFRSMRWHADPYGNDTWHCYGCSRDVTRLELEALTNGLVQWPPQCFDCGPQAVVVDMKSTPPTIAGCTCFRRTDTYLQPIACWRIMAGGSGDAVGYVASSDDITGIDEIRSIDGIEVASSDDGLDGIDGIEELRSMVQQHQDDDVRTLATLAAGWLFTSES